MSARLQACTLTRLKANLVVLPLFYIAGFFFINRQNVAVLTLWIVLLPASVPANLWIIPAFRLWLRRNRADEQVAPALSPPASPASEVTLYTALGCPYCPLVHRRLERLRATMGFKLRLVNLTLSPSLATTNSIASVPVVEAHGQRLVGNASIAQLVALIAGTVAIAR